MVGIPSIAATVVTLLALLPRPVVSSPTGPTDPANSFSVSYDVSNAAFVPLRDVSASLAVGQITGTGAKLTPQFIPSFESRFTNPEWQGHNLGMDERFTINLESMFRQVGYADIAIVVSYKPWVLPFKREKIFRFVTFKHPNGEIYWRSWPLNEPAPQF